MYIFANLSPDQAARQESSCVVKIVDFNLRRIFGIEMFLSKPENRPQTVRVNYSLASFKHKAYLYGGLNSSLEVLDSVEEFDATTYKFSLVKQRGDFKPKGRQAHAAIALDQYSMLVVGGSYQVGLVDPAPIQEETGSPLLIFDMDASTFS
jgi:hypothetical protein